MSFLLQLHFLQLKKYSLFLSFDKCKKLIAGLSLLKLEVDAANITFGQTHPV